jgi:cell division protein ZapA
MSKEQQAVKVSILDKEYLVACQEEEKDDLLASAKFLNDRMLGIREGGKVVGIDRIAVMTALNLAHDVIKSGGGGEAGADSYAARINKLNTRIEQALDKYKLRDLN